MFAVTPCSIELARSAGETTELTDLGHSLATDPLSYTDERTATYIFLFAFHPEHCPILLCATPPLHQEMKYSRQLRVLQLLGKNTKIGGAMTIEQAHI